LLTRLGEGQLRLGKADAAAASFSRSVELLRAGENWSLIGQTLGRVGEAYLADGKASDALVILSQAEVIAGRGGDGAAVGRVHGLSGLAHAALRQNAQAEDRLQKALFAAREAFDSRAEAEYLAALGRLRWMQNDVESAVIYYRQALHTAYAANDGALLDEASLALAPILQQDGRTLAQAAELLREVLLRDPRNPAARRLLRRVERRLQRTAQSGLRLPEATSNREYAAEGYIN
jgi:tetratricopeptide (TPR) repeat protein